MPKVHVFNLEGEKKGDINLSADVFGLASNNSLLHQAYVVIESNRRRVIAHTKNRGERAGSGKKPWRQKGTGNARVGSVRNPVWRKGGIVFGPTKDRNFKKDINKKMMRKAILLALSEKARKNSIIVVDKIEISEKKTREFAKALENLKVSKSVLISFSENEKGLKIYSRNICNATNISTSNLNVYDLLNNNKLLLSKESIKYLEEKYGKKKQ